MDEQRFEELFGDVNRWIQQARRLKIAGDVYVGQVTSLARGLYEIESSEADHTKQGNQSKVTQRVEIFELLISLISAQALLYGLAIENACKARLIHMGKVYAKDGRAKKLRSDHNLSALIRDAGYSPNEQESRYLEYLSFQLRFLAKYPIAKDLKTQNDMARRGINMSSEDHKMTGDLIHKVLKEQELIDVFGSSGIAY